MSLSIPKKSNMQFSILPKQYASVDGEILYTFDQDQPQTVDFRVIEQPSARLLAGDCADFRQNYLAAPLALYTRLLLQPRLDIRTGQSGTTAPKTSWGQPADDEALHRRRHALHGEARALLRRAVEYIETHRDEFPEYRPEKNTLNRCSTDGGFVQIR